MVFLEETTKRKNLKELIKKKRGNKLDTEVDIDLLEDVNICTYGQV